MEKRLFPEFLCMMKRKRKIVLSNTKFNLKTANILQKTASLLFRGRIVKMIEEEYGIPTQELEKVQKKY
jgi:hypothetical protein